MSVVEIRGWLSEQERLALRRWSFNKEVLELGAYEGLSSCNIALTAKGLVTVDTFDGRGTYEPKATEEIFWNNMQSIEHCPVQVHVGRFDKVLPTLDRKFDLIFIDGSHDYDSVVQDTELSVPLLKEDGWLVYHDYHEQDPGVVKAVNELVENGAWVVDQVDSLAVIRLGPPPSAPPVKTQVVIGMPHRDGWAVFGAVRAACNFPTKKYDHIVLDCGTSILTHTFNELLCHALNLRDKEGYTHFAMLHNDVVPELQWVDVLLQEMETHKLDMISAVVPLKNDLGLTSTATDTPGYHWGVRRLTMSEVMQMPETFTAQDIPHRIKDAGLLLNTGCWLMRIDQPWMQGLHFRQHDRIINCLATKSWAAQGMSEDWDFSRQLHDRGCRLGATRKVSLYHQFPQYHNRSAWGLWQEDQDFHDAERETARVKRELEDEASRGQQDAA
jgi:hypothetical protein